MKTSTSSKLIIPLATGLIGLFLFIPSPSWAVPLGEGDYAITMGDLNGSTFTINGSGVFTAWHILFPAAGASPATTFTSDTPSPSSNFVTLVANRLEFLQGDFFYSFATFADPNREYEYRIFEVTPGSLEQLKFGSGDVEPIPEPSTLLLMATGLLGLAGYQWHQLRREGTQVG